MNKSISLDGSSLTLTQLFVTAGQPNNTFELQPSAITRMQRGRALVLQALESEEPVYGLTTGLGSRVSQRLDKDSQQNFSLQTLRGRAHAMGKPLPSSVVRAAMLVRLNTMLTGASGADPKVAWFLAKCLELGLVPVIGETGSIGVADLCWGATMGLALAGEGLMSDAEGVTDKAGSVLSVAGLSPLVPGVKDGLVLASHSGFSGAMFALNAVRARSLLGYVQLATAVTMEAMRANLTPLEPVASQLHPQRGQMEAAEELLSLLQHSGLHTPGSASKLQDPLSIRNAVHIHAAVWSAVTDAEECALKEINSVTDNPLVDIESGRILSCGTYYTAHLTVSIQAVNAALCQLAAAQTARLSKMLSHRISGMPQYLAESSVVSNGMAPLMKLAESLLAEIQQAATPAAHWPGMNADGIEDIQSHAPIALKAQRRLLAAAEQLCAIELLMAARAVQLRAPASLAPAIQQCVAGVGNVAGNLLADHSWTAALNALSVQIQKRLLLPLPDMGKVD